MTSVDCEDCGVAAGVGGTLALCSNGDEGQPRARELGRAAVLGVRAVRAESRHAARHLAQ